MPARYYARSYGLDGASLKVVYIDTAPLIDKYRREGGFFPDAAAQDMERQGLWIDSMLGASPQTRKMVIGHHSVYAQTLRTRKNAPTCSGGSIPSCLFQATLCRPEEFIG